MPLSASHGTKAVVKLGTHAVPGTVVDITGWVNSAGLPLTRDMAETTVFGLTSKTFIPGLKDAKIPIEGRFDTTIAQQIFDLWSYGDLAALEYHPAGTATGTTKFTMSGYISNFETKSGLSDANNFTAEFQASGDVTRATN